MLSVPAAVAWKGFSGSCQRPVAPMIAKRIFIDLKETLT